MPATGSRTEPSQRYASEPFETCTLALDRRNSKLTQLRRLRERCTEAAGVLTIDHEVDQIRASIRCKALDEDFSVAVRERWQNWSRNANPFRSDLASSAASELNSAVVSEPDSDEPSDDSAAEEPSEQEETSSARKRKRRSAFRAKDIKIKVGDSELDLTQGWDAIRSERESQLHGLDAALPSAFRFDQRQLQVYAHRLKPKYINSLDRPFEVKDIHKLLRPTWQPPASSNAHDAQSGPSNLTDKSKARSHSNVFTVSFFSSSLGLSKEEAAASIQVEPSNTAPDTDGDSMRDDYVKRVCGDGLGGMRRSQTVELLSTHTLLDLQSSLVCWSDGQPERYGWRRRLARQLNKSRAIGKGQGAGMHTGTPSQRQAQTSPQASLEHDDDEEEDGNVDARLARFTGRRRETDAALVIEDKLYTRGVRHGDAAHEADYAKLLDDWKKSTGNITANVGWKAMGGDLNLRLDQLVSIRIGKPYWMLHQGDCVHCFVVEQVRALRPSEQLALQNSVTTVSVENAPAEAALIRFPRVTWLSTPTMLRFAADNKDNYGLGHRILHWDGLLPLTHPGLDLEASLQDASQAGPSLPTALQIAMGRTKRKDEGLLRKKQGKCLACSWRKAQVGILGGDRVRFPSTTFDQDDDAAVQDDPVIEGLDDHLITVCTSCAALLGLPTRSANTVRDSGETVELDWQRIDSEKGRDAGWTVFPMY
ncbi:uncharacterized protein UTRI_00171_B [Ustilago trichophora]|uniref:Uncharacterized protein n=1 Tax=Ustilago trichophora TaxID=86804 RepID=A0A5C3DS32_9BASI|nr:uncharacterized protein UTRI_00171_B [Ustilago trichophora]